jgi:hypothetical protein
MWVACFWQNAIPIEVTRLNTDSVSRKVVILAVNLTLRKEGAMATATGYITVYESSDGGTGDLAKTTWQFFVGPQAVNTANQFFAETARLAIETNSPVTVTFDPTSQNKLSQVRIAFKYCSETRRLECKPLQPQD